MGLLVDHEILDEIKKGNLGVDPFDPSLINPSGLDFRCGRHYTKTIPTTEKIYGVDKFGQIKDCSYYSGQEEAYGIYKTAPMWALSYIDPKDKSTFKDETFEADEYYLAPGESILVSMFEHLVLPPYLTAEVKGKSSLARLFVANSSIGGVIDPGWTGVITLEITNMRQDTFIKLTEGMKIGQLLIFNHEVVDRDYKEVGRYSHQAPGAGSLGV